MQDVPQKQKEKIVGNYGSFAKSNKGHVAMKEETTDDFWFQFPPVILVSSDDELVWFTFPLLLLCITCNIRRFFIKITFFQDDYPKSKKKLVGNGVTFDDTNIAHVKDDEGNVMDNTHEEWICVNKECKFHNHDFDHDN